MSPRLRAFNLCISLDGFLAGPSQSVDAPMGVGAMQLHQWRFGDGLAGSMDEPYAAAGWDGIGATIMGRNMFGPVRGEWSSADEWRGWWGDSPPFGHPVFVLTHFGRDPLEMEGGTVFHFVTDGIESALSQAVEAAGGLDVRLGGGASTVQQYLRAGLVDEMHIAISPVLLGDGERLFDGVGVGASAGYECVELVSSPTPVVHARLVKRS